VHPMEGTQGLCQVSRQDGSGSRGTDDLVHAQQSGLQSKFEAVRLAEGTLEERVLLGEADHAISIMNLTQPCGVTPLKWHIEEIKQMVKELESELHEIGSRVTIILPWMVCPRMIAATAGAT